MSKAQTDEIAALRIELDATKAALAKSEGARSALAAELERMVSAPNERAEKAEAACAALRESLKEANDVACLDACDHYGDTIVHNKECSAVADLLASPNPGEDWVSPEAFGRIVAELECPPDVDEVLKEVSRLQEAVRDDLRGTMRRERDEARAERDSLTKQVEALNARAGHFHSCGLELNNATRERDSLREQLAALNGTPQRRFTRIMEELEKVLGPHPSPYRSDEVGEEHYLRVIKANVERLGDAERVIETLRGNVRPLHSHKCWQTLNHLATNCTCGAGAIAFAIADFDAKWGKR